MTGLRWAWSTPLQPGAIAAVTVHGDPASLDALLAGCCRRAPAAGATARCTFVDESGAFDDGVAARITPDTAILMPHGGVRIAQRVKAWLRSAGADESALPDTVAYP
ncbi:MAG: hypothetical protein ACO3DS_10135, partial [Phycisphaerales bacterium]